MSDFDKEAERERLREKYEHDKQKREATEQMSELLLQGATMTNAHCSECNDPIFRYDGQEFCATCERPVDRDTGDEPDDEEPADGESAESIEVTAPSDDARVQFGGEAAQPSGEAPDEPAGNEPQPNTGERVDQQTAASSGARQERHGHQQTDTQRTRRQPEPTNRSRSPQPTGDSQPATDLQSVKASLVRTMTRFAERAEASEDPQQAAEYLAAVREAAETLDALR